MKRSIILLVFAVLCGTRLFAQFGDSKGPYGHKIYSIAFTSADYPIVAAYDYMWRYDGSNWNKIQLLPSPLATYPVDGSLFRPVVSNGAGTLWQTDHTLPQDGLLWKSTNNGFTWNSITPSGLPQYVELLCLKMGEASNVLLGGSMRYLHNNNDTVKGGVWKSTNAGNSWSLLGNQSVVGLDTLQVRDIVVKADTIFAATNGFIFRSYDNGQTWTKTTGFSDVSVLSLAISGNNLIVGTGTGGFGIYLSTNKGDSFSLKDSVGENHRLFLTKGTGNTVFAADYDGTGIYRSTDNGNTWQSKNNGLLATVPNGLTIRTISVDDNGVVYAGTSSDGIFKSTNNGDLWVQMGVPVSISTTTTSGSLILAASAEHGTVYRSTDRGNTYARLNIGVTDAVDGFLYTEEDLYIGTEANGIRKSTDNGTTWQTVMNGFPNPNITVFCFGISATGTIFAGTNGYGIYKTTNGGTLWQQADAGITGSTKSITVSTASKNFDYVFAGTGLNGVYRSTNNGSTWTQPSAALNNKTISTISVDKKGIVFAGTTFGVYKSTNNGSTWTGPTVAAEKVTVGTVVQALEGVNSIAIPDSELIYTATSSGLYKSTDEGDSWTLVTGEALQSVFGTSSNTITGAVSSVTLDDSGYLYVGSVSGLVRSTFPATLRPEVTQTVPLDAAPSVMLPAVLSWNASGALSYRVTVSTDPLFTLDTNGVLIGTVFDSSGITDTALSVSGLSYTTTYYWRVRGKNENGYGVSAFRSFTTSIAPPLTSTLASPSDGAVNVWFPVALVWSVSETAVSYDATVATDSFFTNTVFDSAGIADTTVTVSALTNGTGYYWRVRGENSGGLGQWSPARRFTTIIAAPGAPTLSAPADNATDLPVYGLVLSWNVGPRAETHEVLVAYDSALVEPFFTTNNFIGTDFEIPVLENLTDYFWTVRGKNVGGTGPWAPVQKFTTGLSAYTYYPMSGWNMVSLPLRVSDASVSTVFSGTVSRAFAYDGGYAERETLSNGAGYWIKTPGTTAPISGYVIVRDTVAVKSGWNMIGSISVEVATNTVTHIPPELSTSSYYWYDGGGYVSADVIEPGKAYWVKASSAGLLVLAFDTPAQQYKRLSIDDVPPPPPGFATASPLPKEYALHNAFPNPFNPTTTISFDLPEPTTVTLTVYTILGETVTTLAAEELWNAGTHELHFNGATVPSGVYFYRLITPRFSAIGKMVLAK